MSNHLPSPPPQQDDTRSWYAKKRFLLPLVAVAAFLVGLGAAAGDSPQPTTSEDTADEDELAALQEERDELQQALEQRDEQIDDLTERLEEAEQELAAAAEEPEPDDLAFADLNEPVDLPPWRFNVTEMRCGQQEMVYETGREDKRYTPQGQYCQALMTIENVGTAPESWDEDASALLDRDGNQYEYDFDATYWGNIRDDNRDFGSRLNPGQATAGSVWFDVPEDAEAAALVVLPDPYSDNAVAFRLADDVGRD